MRTKWNGLPSQTVQPACFFGGVLAPDLPKWFTVTSTTRNPQMFDLVSRRNCEKLRAFPPFSNGRSQISESLAVTESHTNRQTCEACQMFSQTSSVNLYFSKVHGAATMPRFVLQNLWISILAPETNFELLPNEASNEHKNGALKKQEVKYRIGKRLWHV